MKSWMSENVLEFNDDKSEDILSATPDAVKWSPFYKTEKDKTTGFQSRFLPLKII